MAEYGFDCNGVRRVDDDPRDAYLLARFAKGEERIDIAWNEMAQSLTILFRISNDQLSRKERYIYFEPFIEFISNGQVLPIAPQLFPRMTLKSIESVMRQRHVTFKEGIGSSMASLATKLREHMESVQSSSAETVRNYHRWYEVRTV